MLLRSAQQANFLKLWHGPVEETSRSPEHKRTRKLPKRSIHYWPAVTPSKFFWLILIWPKERLMLTPFSAKIQPSWNGCICHFACTYRFLKPIIIVNYLKPNSCQIRYIIYIFFFKVWLFNIIWFDENLTK